MKPPTDEIAKGWVAHTETQWVFSEIKNQKGKIRFLQEFLFLPEESWTITDSKFILAHENTHYRISLLWFNKMTVEMDKYDDVLIKNRGMIIKIFNHCWQEQLKLQILFDKETDHGRNKSMELKWEEQIKKDLK